MGLVSIELCNETTKKKKKKNYKHPLHTVGVMLFCVRGLSLMELVVVVLGLSLSSKSLPLSMTVKCCVSVV